MKNAISCTHALFALGAVVAMSSCNCGNNVGAAKKGSVTGVVFKGSVAGATVKAFEANDAGRRGKELGTATAADDGSFTVDVGSHAGPMLVTATQGTYTEEATGGLVQLGANELSAFVDAHEAGDSTSANLTPLTSLHAGLTACFAESGREATLAGASSRASLRLNDFFSAGVSGFDVRTTVPANPTLGLAASLTPEAWSGIVIAGLSESAKAYAVASGLDPGVRVTAATLTTALQQDIDDGACVFNGRTATAQLIQGDIELTDNALRGAPQGLAISIVRFLEGPQNQSGIAEGNVSDLVQRLQTHTSEIFAGGGGGDATRPVVTILEPLAGAVSGVPAIRVEASDDNTIETLAFTAPDFLVDSGDLTCASPGSCVLLGTLNTSLIEGGAATITVEAIDQAGNRATASVDVTVNNTAPAIQVNEPTDDDVVAAIQPIVAEVSDPDGVASFTVEIPGIVVAANCAPPVLTTNCDSDPDPNKISILWDTTQSNEGPTTISFVAVDTAGLPAFADVGVVVDNLAAGVINGRVDLGAPVTGATLVSLFALEPDGTRGALLGFDSEVGPDGSFQIEDTTSRAEPMLVVATGGAFTDVASGLTLEVNPGQELLSAIDAGTPGGVVTANVNAWTTLAARRALTHIAEEDGLADAIRANRRMFELFFRRPAPELPLPIQAVSSANLTEGVPVSESSDGALLALAHAGLSRLALDTSIATGQAAGAITIVDVLNRFGLDVSDALGQFDGRSGDTPLFFDSGETEALNSLTPRARLAVAIFAFTTNSDIGDVVQPRNTSGITGASIATPNRILDDIALYAEPRLFPETEPPQPFDREPPTIVFEFLDPHEGSELGDELDGLVTIQGVATDVSDITRFEVIGPTGFDGLDIDGDAGDTDIQLTIGTDRSPSIVDAALTCGLTAGDPPLDLANRERQVCFCAEATDLAANTAATVACFSRADISIGTSPPQLAVLPINFGSIQATLTSGFDMQECDASLARFGAQSRTNLADAQASGRSCSLTIPIPIETDQGDFTTSGTQPLETLLVDVRGNDIAGIDREFVLSYQVDTRRPVVTIASPFADGEAFSSPPTLAATVTDLGSGLASVVATVRNGATVLATLTGTVDGSGNVSFPAFSDPGFDGDRDITFSATDVAGNTTVVERSYSKDTTPPAVADAAAQPSIMQMPNGTATTTTGNCTTFPYSTCAINPNGTLAANLKPAQNAANAPLYQRWAHLAGQTSFNPPALTLQTEPFARVRARVDAVCANSNEAAFTSRSGQSITADANGLATILIGDIAGINDVSFRHSTQAAAVTMCLTYRVEDRAASIPNTSQIFSRFYRYQATVPTPLIRWNDAPFTGVNDPEEIESKDAADDDDAVRGTGQGAAGRYFAHAYVIAPFSPVNYSFRFPMTVPASGVELRVDSQATLKVSRTRATDWCFETGAHSFRNLAHQIGNQVGATRLPVIASGSDAPDRTAGTKLWSYATTDGALQTVRTAPLPSNGIFPPLPSNPSTATDTVATATPFDLVTKLGAVTVEAWSVNTANGNPSALAVGDVQANAVLIGNGLFGLRMLRFRAPVTVDGVTLTTFQTAQNVNGQFAFNDECGGQFTGEPLSSFLVTGRATATQRSDPLRDVISPLAALWMFGGNAGNEFCDGTASAGDCRYAMSYTKYRGASWNITTGTTLTPTGGVVPAVGNPTLAALPATTIPVGASRTLSP